MKNRVQDIVELERDLRIAQQEEIDTQEPKRAELEALEANIAQTERRAAELANVLTMLADKDGIVAKSVQMQIDQTNALHREQTERRAALQAELEARRLTDAAIGDILTYARDVREGIDSVTFNDKRRTLEILKVEITVKGERFNLKSLLGVWDGELLNALSSPAPASTIHAGSP